MGGNATRGLPLDLPGSFRRNQTPSVPNGIQLSPCSHRPTGKNHAELHPSLPLTKRHSCLSMLILPPRLSILPVINAALALKHSEFGSHVILHVVTLAAAKFCRYRVVNGWWRDFTLRENPLSLLLTVTRKTSCLLHHSARNEHFRNWLRG